MGYVLKQPRSENQVREQVKTQETQSALDALKNAIDAEANLRINDDVNLNLRLDSIQQNLSNEISNRSGEANNLRAALDAEKTARSNADSALEKLITDEISARNDAESDLRDDFNSALENEQAARSKEVADAVAAIRVSMGDDKALEAIENDKIRQQIEQAAANQSANLSALETRLADEESNRANAITAVQSDLADEILARQNNDLQLKNSFDAAIDTEITDRKAAIATVEKNLADNIKTVNASIDKEVNDRKTAITGVETKLTNNIKTVNSSIDKEVNDRKSAITGVEKNLADNIKTVNSSIDKEISDRKTAITNVEKNLADNIKTVNASIDKEISDRKTAITGVETSLTNKINADIAALREDTSRLVDKIDLANQLASIEENLNDFTAPTADEGGKRGLVPNSPAGTDMRVLTNYGWRTPDDATLTIAVIPQQVGDLVFNRQVQEPTWLNFDTKKLKIEGTTSASDAGVYSVTFTPLDIYLWADTLDQQPKTATWTISAMKLAKPTAAITEFTYNRNSQALNFSNFDDTYESQTGVISATDANSYTATFKLKNTNNTHWSDDSIDDVNINWEIKPLKLAKPSIAVTEFTYDSSTKTVEVADFDSIYESQTGTISAVNANSYTATFKLKNTSNTHWSDDSVDDVNIDWEIKPLKLAKPSIAVTEFVYDSTTKTVEVADFDSVYESQTGTISAVNANSYTATFKLKNTNNTHWSDDSIDDVNIDWEIKPLKLTKPSIAVTEFVYDSTTKTVEVADFNSDYESQTGTISAVNANSYTATFKLKNTSNTHWSDDSTTDINIDWQIKPLKLTKPSIAVNEFTFDSSTKTVSVSNFNSNYESQTGTTQAISAGDYSITFKLKNTTNTHWSDDSVNDVIVNWQIKKLKLAKPTASVTEFDGDGKSKTLSVSNFDSKYINQTGTVTATDAGTYNAVYSLKTTDNTTWADDSTADVTITWKINLRILSAAQSSGFAQVGTLTYSGSELSPTIQNYDPNYHELSSTTSAVDAGSYKLQITPKAGCVWSNKKTTAKTVTWKIGKKSIAKPTADTVSFDYDGKAKTLAVKNFDSTIITQTGSVSETNAGDFKATFNLKSTKNYCWADNSTAAVNINWSINKKPIVKPSCATTSFTYSGDEKSITVQNVDTNYMSESGTKSAVNAGSYSVTYALANSNFQWEDSTTANVIIRWQIDRKKLTKAQSEGFAQDGELVYNDKYQTVTIKNFDENYHQMTGDTGKYGARDWTAYVSPLPNYCWYDGTVSAKEVVWTIKKLGLKFPNITNATYEYPNGNKWSPMLAYTGSTIKPQWDDNFISRYMKLGGDYQATNIKSCWETAEPGYVATVSLKYPQYTYWLDWKQSDYESYKSRGVYYPQNDTADWNVEWWIEYNFIPEEYDYDKIKLTTDKITYAGNYIYITDYIENLNSTYHEISNKTSHKDIGTYQNTIKPKTGYAWRYTDFPEEEITLTWQIVPFIVSTPTVAVTDFEFDGTTHTISISNFDALRAKKSGTESAKDIGTYKITFSLKGKEYGDVNTAWSTGGTDDIVIEWTIGLSRTSAPVITANSFTYDGNSHSPTFDGFDSSIVTLSGTTEAVNAGTYTAKVSLINKNVYVWEDGTNGDLTYTWRINRKPLTATQSTFSQAGTLDFNGNSQTVTIQNYDPTYHTLGGTFNAINAGTYNARISPLPNYCFNDGSTSYASVNWSINPLKLVKPSASTTSFNFDKNTHSLEVSNFNSTYINQTGKTSESAEGVYTATYSLKNSNNTVWADNSISNVNITWSITKQTFSKPTAANTSFTYNTKSQALSISNFNSNFMTQDGVTSAVDAGNYTVTFSLKDKSITQWEDASTDDVVINWSIARAKLTYAQSNPYQKVIPTYNGNTFSINTAALLEGFTENVVFVEPTPGLGSFKYKTASAGTHRAIIQPAENYCWYNGYTSAKNLYWQIARAKINPPTISGTLTYNEAAQSPTLSGYDSDKMTLSGDTSKTDAGTYSLNVTPTSNYCWQDDSTDAVTLDWSIQPLAKYKKPIISILHENGTEVSYERFDNTNHIATPTGFMTTEGNSVDYDASLVTVSGTTQALHVGTYTANFTFKSPNYIWGNSKSNVYSYSWKINNRAVNKPIQTATYLDYTGNSQAAPINASEKSVDYYSVSGTTQATNAGNYKTVYSLKYPSDTQWYYKGANTKAVYSTDDVIFYWSIGLTPITAPTLTQNYFDYDGSTHTVTINNFDDSTMTKSGTESADFRGFYKITFKLKDKVNNCWSTGGNEDIVIEWALGQKRIAKPTLTEGIETEFTYDGNSHSITLEGFDSNTMYLTETLSATDAGDYHVEVRTRTTATCQYVWPDDSVVAFDWKINPAIIDFDPDAPPSQKPYSIRANPNVYYYSGNDIYVTIQYYDPATMIVTGEIFAKDAGNHTAYISPDSNHTWKTGSKAAITATWCIKPQYISKPTINVTEFDFDGKAHSVSISNFDSTLINQTGTTSAAAVGTYSVIFSLKDSNHCWQDGSSDDITINWKINPKSIDVPTLAPASQTSKGLNETHSVSVSGFDSNIMSMSGDTSVSTGAAATYTVTFSLKDKNSAQWSDGTNSDKKVTWKVTRKILSSAESSFAQDSPVTFNPNGSPIPITDICSSIKPEYLGVFYNVSVENIEAYFDSFARPSKHKPGNHTITVTLTDAAAWYGNSTTDKSFTVTVDKAPAPAYMSLSNTTFTHKTSQANTRLPWFNSHTAYFYYGSVEVTATSSNPNVLTIAGITATATTDPHVKVTTVSNGDATVTVNFKSDYYVVPESLTADIKVRVPLYSCDWSEIKSYLAAGTFSNFFSVGDYVPINVKGTVGCLDIDGSYRAVLIGIDHNSGIQGSKRAHFAVMQNSTGKNIVFVDKYYSTQPDDADKQNSFTRAAEWDTGIIYTYQITLFRNRCYEFYEALPADLRNVISTTKIPYINAAGNVNYINDNVFIPSQFEIFGRSKNSSMLAQYAVYDYWANGNSKICYRHDNPNTAAEYWLRDPDLNGTGNAASFWNATVSNSGSLVIGSGEDESWGFLPCFSVSG